MFKKMVKISSLYWRGSDRNTALMLLLISLSFTLAIVYAQYRLTLWNEGFYDSIQRLDSNAFKEAIQIFFLLASGFVVVAVSQFYFSQILAIRWRKWLTEYSLELWLDNGSYYFYNHLEKSGDNPDQRISEDIKDFVDTTVELSLEVVRQIVTLVTFSSLLWRLSGSFKIYGVVVPGFLFWACVVYAFLGTLISHKIGRKIAPLNYKQQSLEADYRFNLVRVRENAESILLMNGGEAENKKLKNIYGLTLDNFYRIVNERKKLSFFTSFYNLLSGVFSFLIAAPKLFAKEISMGQMFQIASAFTQVSSALSFAVEKYPVLAKWSSVIDRLDEFYDAMERSKNLRSETESRYSELSTHQGLSTSDLNIAFPGGKRSTKALNLDLKKGDSLMIVGPSGAGKSTLLRIFSKIWPYFDGKVSVPWDARSMMITQVPYLSVGKLKDAIVYPLAGDDYADHEVRALLNFCELESLSGRLQETAHWSQILSPGEQQRLSWVRVFLYKPDLLYIDEATSALDSNMQFKLYSGIKERLPKTTVVSVAHRRELEQFHTNTLIIN